jgi:excisionase family DNA binding protein
MTALLTEQEAAREIGLSARTLRALRSAGKIRYIRPTPRKILYSADDIAEFLDKHRCQDEPPCPSINPPKANSGTTTSGSTVIGITALRAARQNAMRNGSKPKSGGKRR